MKGLNKLGYILIVLGFITFGYKYGRYLLFETTYLLMGYQINERVSDKLFIDGKVIYSFKLNDLDGGTYVSMPTSKSLEVNEDVVIRVVPIFKKVFFGHFFLLPYTIGIIMFLLATYAFIIAIFMLLGIKNSLTEKIW